MLFLAGDPHPRQGADAVSTALGCRQAGPEDPRQASQDKGYFLDTILN